MRPPEHDPQVAEEQRAAGLEKLRAKILLEERERAVALPDEQDDHARSDE
jgi:hypothetical protein